MPSEFMGAVPPRGGRSVEQNASRRASRAAGAGGGGALPRASEVWYSVPEEDGDDYYFWNPATGETTWQLPEGALVLATASAGGDEHVGELSNPDAHLAPPLQPRLTSDETLSNGTVPHSMASDEGEPRRQPELQSQLEPQPLPQPSPQPNSSSVPPPLPSSAPPLPPPTAGHVGAAVLDEHVGDFDLDDDDEDDDDDDDEMPEEFKPIGRSGRLSVAQAATVGIRARD